MKYSFMSFSCQDATLTEMLGIAGKYGYDGIEPRVEAKHAHGIELGITVLQAGEIRKYCEAEGVEISCIATSCSFSDPETAKTETEKAFSYIKLAENVGTRLIRVFGGGIPYSIMREQAFDSVVESLRTLAKEASDSGVIICLETHDSWCDAAEVKRVMEAVNERSIGVNWDIMHPVLTAGQTIEEAYTALKPWIKHVHIHDGLKIDGKLKFTPIGTGKVDHQSAVRLLKADGYDGYLSGEWINCEPYDIHLPREIASLKNFE